MQVNALVVPATVKAENVLHFKYTVVSMSVCANYHGRSEGKGYIIFLLSYSMQARSFKLNEFRALKTRDFQQPAA